MCSCSSACCTPSALGTADVRASATSQAQQRGATVVAGRQSDEDKDKRHVLQAPTLSRNDGWFGLLVQICQLQIIYLCKCWAEGLCGFLAEPDWSGPVLLIFLVSMST